MKNNANSKTNVNHNHFSNLYFVGITGYQDSRHGFLLPNIYCGLGYSKYMPDLPTPITCKSGGFEKQSRKTWRLGPQTWRLQKYASNTSNNNRLFVSEYSFSY